jgi:hypothetical protein
MPIDLSSIPPPEPLPKKPSKLVWTIVFLVLTIIGMAAVLILWPKNEPTHTPWFWICFGVFPPAFAGFVVLRRFSVYHGRLLDARAWNTAREEHLHRLKAHASTPVVILKSSCRLAGNIVENPASMIATRSLNLGSQPSIALPGSIRAGWFAVPDVALFKGKIEDDVARQLQVLNWLFDECISDLKMAVLALPPTMQLAIHLSVTMDNFAEASVRQAWGNAWASHELRAHPATIESEPLSLLALETWLDATDKAAQQRARMVVQVQLNKVLSDNPPVGSAEAVVALLLVRTEAASSHALEAQAFLHRPVRGAIASLPEKLGLTLKWGRSPPSAIQDVWHSGLDADSALPLFAAVRGAAIVVSSAEPDGRHDIDQAIGYCGAAAPWLAAAFAAEHSAGATKPQLVAHRLGEEICLLVVSPQDRPVSSDRDSTA